MPVIISDTEDMLTKKKKIITFMELTVDTESKQTYMMLEGVNAIER